MPSPETTPEVERLQAELDNSMKIIWRLAREAGGSTSVSVQTLCEMRKESRLEICPSSDGVRQHITARL